MGESFGSRLKHAWNAFNSKGDEEYYYPTASIGPSYGSRPDRRYIVSGSERTIIASIYTRIAIDVASTTFEHVRVDDEGRYQETVNSDLNMLLNIEANLDQTGFAFLLDVAYSLLEEGTIAVCPIDFNVDIRKSPIDAFKFTTARVGKIVAWYPKHVRVRLYDENSGEFKEVTFPKQNVAILENPFYSVMNEPNSTLKRLVYKLSLLDDADAKANSSRLDMIVQLPYTVKTPTQEKRAADRKASIENQLTNSKYGIAYIDATEKVTQLNRSIENTLPQQVTDLRNQLYSQLGIDETILNGAANADTMNNYYQRTVAPIIKTIKDEFIRKFLSKTARSQHQTIMTFQDPFKYLTVVQIANLVDSLSRNEVLTGNEFRTALGFKPSDEPGADELRNKNLIDPNADYGTSPESQYMGEQPYNKYIDEGSE